MRVLSNVLLSAMLLSLCMTASAAYYLKINGETAGAEYTMNVGTAYTVEVWSDSATPMSVEPTATSEWMQDGYSLQMWTGTWGGAPEAFTNLVFNNASAGWSAYGWTNASPYQNLVHIGFVTGYPYGTPTAAGKWWEVTYTPGSAGTRVLGLGSYTPGYSEFRNAQYITIHQNDFDLAGFISTWLYELGDAEFDPQFDLVKDNIVNLQDFAVFARMIENTFYVSVNDGSDTNDGSLNSPFKTIQKAKDVVRARITGVMNSDVTVLIRGGTYLLENTLTFDAADSGKNGYKVIYKGYKNEMPAISAAKRITGWQLDAGNVYKVYIGTTWKPQTLFENGQWAYKARTPNTGYFSADTGSAGKRTLVYRAGDVPTFDVKDATVQVWSGSFLGGAGVWNYDWMSNISRISSANWGTRTLTLSQDTWFDLAVHNRYYLQGARVFLDVPGEWYHDTTTGWLYYYPYATPIGNQQILGGSVKRLFRIQGISPNRVQNISFESLHFSMSDSLLQYRPFYDDYEGMLYLETAEHIRFNKCRFSNAGTAALCFNGHVQHCEVTNSLIENCGTYGIVAKGFEAGYGGYTSPVAEYVNKFNTIHNNHFRNTGIIAAHGWGIFLYHSGDNTITHNKFENLPRHGVGWAGTTWPGLKGRTIYGIPITWENRLDFCYARNNLVAYNEFVNCMYDSSDAGAINSYGAGAGNRIENNFIHDMTGLPASAGMGSMLMGIYLDDPSNFTTVRKNIVTRLNGASVVVPYLGRGEGNVFENNIAVNNAAQYHIIVYQNLENQEPPLNTVIARNIFYQMGGDYVFQLFRSPWDDSAINQMVASSDYNVVYHTSGTYRVHRPAASSSQQNMSWTTWKSYGYEANSTTGQDPLFTDIANDDYTLLPGSPALLRGFEQIDLSNVGLTGEFPF